MSPDRRILTSTYPHNNPVFIYADDDDQQQHLNRMDAYCILQQKLRGIARYDKQ